MPAAIECSEGRARLARKADHGGELSRRAEKCLENRAEVGAAIAGMREDGGTDLGAILRALLSAPGQLPAMIRLAYDARAAFAAIERCRHSLGAEIQPPRA